MKVEYLKGESTETPNFVLQELPCSAIASYMKLVYDMASPQSSSSDCREAHIAASLIHESRVLRQRIKAHRHCHPITLECKPTNTSDAKFSDTTSH